MNKSGKKGEFGLYITDKFVQAAQLKSNGKKLSITAAGQLPLPEGTVRNGEIIDKQVLAAAIKKLLESTKPAPINDTLCHIAIPENQIYEYVFIVPEDLKGIELKRKIQELVKETMPLATNELIYRYLEEARNKERFIHVYAARKKVLKDYLDVARNYCHLSPQSLEPESIALIRILDNLFPKIAGTLLFDERADELIWFTLIGDKVFESGIEKISTQAGGFQNMLIDLKRSAQVLTSKTGAVIKEVILPDEMDKKFPELKNLISGQLGDINFSQEKYHIGNYYYKVACSLGLKTIGMGSNGEINFQK